MCRHEQMLSQEFPHEFDDNFCRVNQQSRGVHIRSYYRLGWEDRRDYVQAEMKKMFQKISCKINKISNFTINCDV